MKNSGCKIEFDCLHDIVIMRFFGVLTFEVAENAVKEAYTHPSVSAATMVLIDTTRAHIHEIDVEWLRRFQALRETLGFPWRVTGLVVSRSEGNQLLGQLWATMRSMKSPEPAGVFTDEGAATAWLLERRDTAGAAAQSA
jgi:hypothetical protein